MSEPIGLKALSEARMAKELVEGIADKLNDGTRITSNFNSIQEALDDLPDTGGRVFVSPGEYKESLLVTKPNTHIFGTWDSVIITPDNAVKGEDDSTMRILANGCLVENLKFYGNPTNNLALNNQPDAVTSDGIGIYASDCTVRNCWFVDTMGHSIIVWNDGFSPYVERGKRVNNIIADNLIEGDGFRAKIDVARDQPAIDGELIHTNGNVVISGNRIRNTNQYAIIIHWGTEISIINNHIENAHTGIRPHGNCVNLNISGNIIRNIPGIGIQLQHTGTPYEKIAVSENIIENTGSFGIQAGEHVDKLIIANNIIKDTGLRAIEVGSKNTIIESNVVEGSFIQDTSSAKNVKVINNIISPGYSPCVRLDGSGAIVRGNTFKDGRYGVFLYGAELKDIVIDSNKFKGCERGINLTSAKTMQIINNDFADTEIPIHRPSMLTEGSVVRGNVGFETERKGIATIEANETTISINHNIGTQGYGNMTSETYGITPEMIQATPLSDLGENNRFWLSDVTATTFTINISNSQNYDIIFSWMGRVN